MRVRHRLMQPTLNVRKAKSWFVLAAQKDKIIDLWRRKCCCRRAYNAFIPHYVAAIQYSEHDLGKVPGMWSRMNERHKMLKTRTIVNLRLLTDCWEQLFTQSLFSDTCIRNTIMLLKKYLLEVSLLQTYWNSVCKFFFCLFVLQDIWNKSNQNSTRCNITYDPLRLKR